MDDFGNEPPEQDPAMGEQAPEKSLPEQPPPETPPSQNPSQWPKILMTVGIIIFLAGLIGAVEYATRTKKPKTPSQYPSVSTRISPTLGPNHSAESTLSATASPASSNRGEPTGFVSNQGQVADLWDPVCNAITITQFEVTARQGDGPTNIARAAITTYFNTLALKSAPNQSPPALSPSEKVYAEDYIIKNLKLGNIYVGLKIAVPCQLVEEATLRARLLTIGEKENLKQFSARVSNFQIQEIIRQIVEEATAAGGVSTVR